MRLKENLFYLQFYSYPVFTFFVQRISHGSEMIPLIFLQRHSTTFVYQYFNREKAINQYLDENL